MTRIFQSMPLKIGTRVLLDSQASHHLARVLRGSVGETVTLFNGAGGEYVGTIVQIDKKNVTVEINNYDPREAESALNLCLAQGISRGEKMDYTIQKAVELGVKQIVPLFTERCNVKLDRERSEKRQQHWQSIVVSACEQSGRNRIPEVKLPQSLQDWLQTVEADVKFVLSPYATHKLSALKIEKTARIMVLIGPEGGLSEREIEFLISKGFLALNLGPRVLRTETAAVAALTALQVCCGDMAV